MLRLVGSFVCLATMICGATALVGATSPGSDTPAAESTAVHQLVPWLLEEDRQLRGIPFSALIADVTGKKVMAFDRKNEVDQRVVGGIGAACDQAMKQLNAPGSAIQKVGRINEVSSYFEQTLRDLLNSTAGLSCDFPKTAQGKVQRFGYPDLRIVDLVSKRVFYLDAKLIAAGGRDSTLRTFYFEPKVATNKVRDDAVHFIAGFEHEPREPTGLWKFTRWDILDLARFEVKLKAEFQASNGDIYRPEAIIATSAK